MERLYVIIRFKLVLSDQETPDKTPEHYVDAEFHADSENHIHSGQFPTIPDIIWDLKCEIERINCDGKHQFPPVKKTTKAVYRQRNM